jgi:hypothetical protein
MTVRDLIEQLEQLPDEDKDLPIKLVYMLDEDGESRSVGEVIDTVIKPQSYGVYKDCIGLTAWF